jgi:rare lipoprotein A
MLLAGFGLLMTAAIASTTPAKSAAYASCGKASWYAMTSKTASGERASPNTMTAAHKTLPFGTKVKVTNQRNGKSVIVRINDRGPYAKGRIIDLTKRAAGQLGFINAGWTSVKVEPVTNLSHKRVKAIGFNC